MKFSYVEDKRERTLTVAVTSEHETAKQQRLAEAFGTTHATFTTSESNFTPERAIRDATGLGEDKTTRWKDEWNQTNSPRIGVRVRVTRKLGDSLIARRDFKSDAVFRDPDVPHWLDDHDKFIDIAMNPVVSWKALTAPTSPER